MGKKSLGHLQKVAQEINDCQTPQEKIDGLSKAFDLFSQETRRLESAYTSLQEKYEAISKELTETNVKLKQKLFELDVTADYLDNIVNHMSQGLLFISSDYLITTYNNAAESILGIPRENVLLHNFSEHFHDDFFGFSMHEALERAEAPKHIFVSLPADEHHAEKRELEIESTFVLKDDTPRSKASSPFSVPTYAMGIIVMIRDITEIQQLQSIASRNDRMKELGEMAAMVAHEIRNPLGSIKGFASLLVRDLEHSPKLREMASHIVTGTDDLNLLVTNVLNFTRPLQLKLDTVDLVTVLKDLLESVKLDNSIPKTIVFHSKLPSQPILARIDLRLFKSALLNLIVNAIQAMPSQGTITLTLKNDKQNIYLSISDSGEGIPSQNFEKLFRPFFTTKPHGHGFGLAEVQRAVQAHNGTIEVESVLGKGTTFTIKLKAAAG